MLQVVPQMKIYVAHQPLDFRKGIDTIAGYCRNVLHQDPYSGAIFVFRNKRRTALKLLVFDGGGFWLCHRRLSAGRLRWWPKAQERKLSSLGARQLQVLLWNGDPSHARFAAQWRPLPEVSATKK